jgi:hypothetical protein
VQQPVQRLDRAHRRPLRVATQVEVQLAVREPVAHLVRPVHGQAGLPDAGHAGQHRDDGRRPGVLRRKHGVQRRGLEDASAESGDVQRQLGRCHPIRFGRHRRRLARDRAHRLAHRLVHRTAQDLLVRRPQLRTRIDAQLLDEPLPGGCIVFQRLRAVTGQEQGSHQDRHQHLGQRLLGHQLGQRCDHGRRIGQP